MQFQFNSDYPGVTSDGKAFLAPSSDPREFPPAQPIPCARITTRIFHPRRNQVATVQNVLVRTMASPPHIQHAGSNLSVSSEEDMSSSSDDDSMMDADVEAMPQNQSLGESKDDRAYWVQRTIREAIYGRVLLAVVLKRRMPTQSANDNAEWEVTSQFCAVKEMSWQHIRRERDRLAEDPIKEVAAMQFLKQWHTSKHASRQNHDTVEGSFQAILSTNIMMPLDLLSDDRHLYSIMPYCDGGELFERLDMNERFSEEEARYWMHQVLNVSRWRRCSKYDYD